MFFLFVDNYSALWWLSAFFLTPNFFLSFFVCLDIPMAFDGAKNLILQSVDGTRSFFTTSNLDGLEVDYMYIITLWLFWHERSERYYLFAVRE